MEPDQILLLKGPKIRDILHKLEKEIIQRIRNAYLTHEEGGTVLPHSVFLNFQDKSPNRIIALPGYLGGEFNVAGIKWIASFPANVEQGLDRASAVMVLNSVKNGRVVAVLEASVISAKRTAASAVLAATYMAHRPVQSVTLVGCGSINFEIVRFLLEVFAELEILYLFDIDSKRAHYFKTKCQDQFNVRVNIKDSLEDALTSANLVSFATTAVEPYVPNPSLFAPATCILNISLRDLSPEVILASENIVDDIDHVCRAKTSVHLTELTTGDRKFIRGSLAGLINNSFALENEKLRCFSPFGLGILDLAIAEMVIHLANERNIGIKIDGFYPECF